MSKSHFEITLDSLLKQREPEIYKILIAVRKEVEWPKNKDNIITLREKGCLKIIVGTMQSPRRNILDVSLSILGNCCMERGCTRDVVGQFNILSILNQLLKKYPKEDSINGRVFRIVGNMCQHRDQWENIIIDRKPQIITYIVDFIKKVAKDEVQPDEKVSEATVLMAIRSLRALLNCQTLIQLVKGFGVLKAVGLLFIKYSVEWQENKKNENLLQNIIRLLQEYSRYKYTHSIMEMRTTEKGDSLVHLSSVLLLAPKRIVKIVMNFIRISLLKSDLPIPEICDKFIEVLNNHSIVKEFNGECVEYLQCLCYLLEHPSNRDSNRCGKCVPLLIQLLQEFKEMESNNVLECCILLLTALNKCKYDESLIIEQVRCNMIKVITEKLHWLVGSSNTFITNHKDEKKRKYKCGDGCCSKISNKRLGLKYEELREPRSPTSSDDEVDFLTYSRLDSSPTPSSSSDSDLHLYSWSSPGSSPKSNVYISASDSDDYSPVCSEADVSDFPLKLDDDDDDMDNEKEKASTGEMDRCSDKEDCDEDMASTTTETTSVISSNLKIRLLTEITKLLKTYIKIKPAIQQLGNADLLFALIKSSGDFEWTYTANVDTIDVVCRILDSHDYLIPLMQSDLIETVFNLTEIQHGVWCTKCCQYQQLGQTILKKFTLLAESGIGKGDIAHKLLRGDLETKQKLVFCIPYIVRNRSILAKLMLNCGGLEILMKLFRGDTDLKTRSIKVLCVMAARKLAIANPKSTANGLNRPKVVADKYKLPETCTNIVTFKLDCGSTIKADKDFLSEKSDFFNRLFNGYFKESSEDVISLQNVDLKPLRCLFHLLECIDKTETIDIDLDLQTLLDVIVLCDRYLMSEMCVSLTDCVEQFRMSESTVPDIYKWSIESGTNLLRVECIAFALVTNIIDSVRFMMFESLFNLGYSEQLVEDIQKLLVRYLTLSEYDSDNFKRKQLKVHLNRIRMKDRLLK